MGTFSSGVGLISGFDIENYVTQMMAIEARPRNDLQDRISENTQQQQALMQVQAMVMAVQLAATNFNQQSVFDQKAASTSNADVLSVTASQFAAPGTYSFTVDRLATTHHLVSRGYGGADSSVGAGSISFEIGQGQLARATSLGFINGQLGFNRGSIQITDRSGASSVVDLTAALTVQDVLDEINGTGSIAVTASVSGDHIVLTDNTGSTSSNLIVEEVGTAQTAASLGLLGASASNILVGSDLVAVNLATQVSELNDGNGVRGLDSGLEDIQFTLRNGEQFAVDLKTSLHETIGTGGEALSNTLGSLNGGAGIRAGTFRITDRNGDRVDIDLTTLAADATVGQLKALIQDSAAAAGMDISVTFGGQDHLTIIDNSDLPSDQDTRADNLIIEDLDGGLAAADLGIVGDTASGTITGERIWRMDTLGDVVNAINNHWNNTEYAAGNFAVAISDDGLGLKVTDNTTGAGNLVIEAVNDSSAAEDLGLITEAGFSGTTHSGRRLVAGLNTTLLRSLNGGTGGEHSNRITAGGLIDITDRAGQSAQVDLTGAQTVQDVLDALNAAGTNISAELNAVGNGIILTDDTDAGAIIGNLIVADVGGDTLAAQLNLVTDTAGATVDSGNLQLQYISEATALDDLRNGQGIRRGSFDIVDANGTSTTVNITSDSIQTVGDLIDEINRHSSQNVRARINDTGDGIILYDDISTGTMAITVGDLGGYSARDLNIHGVADANENFIDGSYEFSLDLGGGDTLEDIVARVNEADVGLQASLINDGSSSPYRLSFTSETSGTAGAVHLDPGATTLDVQTITRGQDAVVLFGGSDSPSPLVISSSSNTLENALKGTTIELLQASDTPVQVEITEDLDGITQSIDSFVQAYNQAMKFIDEVDHFDPETLQRSVLYGDTAVRNLSRTLEGLVHKVFSTADSFNRLSDVGLTFTTLGTETGVDAAGATTNYAVAGTPQLSFDETQFRAMYSADPTGVIELFTTEDVGIGAYVGDTLERLASSSDSMLSRRVDSMETQQQLFQDRIDYLDELLEAKELRLYNSFYAMEQALASMQSQQSALAGLMPVTSRTS